MNCQKYITTGLREMMSVFLFTKWPFTQWQCWNITLSNWFLAATFVQFYISSCSYKNIPAERVFVDIFAEHNIHRAGCWSRGCDGEIAKGPGSMRTGCRWPGELVGSVWTASSPRCCRPAIGPRKRHYGNRGRDETAVLSTKGRGQYLCSL